MPRNLRAGPEPVDIAVGARIRLRRRALELSQTALAKSVGVTFQQVQKYEGGSNRVSASMLVKIAAVLETTVAALVGEDGKPIDHAMLAQLAREGAVKLLGAYAKIEKPEPQRALIRLANALAARATSQDRKRA